MIPFFTKVKSKSGTPSHQTPLRETIDYEIISMKYFGSAPIIWEGIQNQEFEPYENDYTSIDNLPSKYLENYQSRTSSRHLDYIIQSDDTLFGLELKFNITRSEIMSLNQISDDLIFPGMLIKIPIKDEHIEQETEKSLSPQKNTRSPQQNFLTVKLMDEIMQKKVLKIYPVYFMAEQTNIFGALSINEDLIFFDPYYNDQNKNIIKNQSHVLQNQAIIYIGDIIQAKIIELPQRLNDITGLSEKDIILQLLLIGVGRKKFEEKHQRKIEKLKKSKQPFAKIHFRYTDPDKKESASEQQKIIQELADIINNKIKTLSDQLQKIKGIKGKQDLKYVETKIPYFDLIQDSQQDQQKLIQQTDQLCQGYNYLPCLEGKSKIIQMDLFVQIISAAPSVFKTGSWSLLYSSYQHGSSMGTLLRNVSDNYPFILMIKDVENWVFGAYISEPLRMSKTFYGSGESFLFTFKNTDQIEIFKWSRVNSDIILCDSDGIAIGCGDKYGIYIKDDLAEGYTSFCSTFMNDQLTKNSNYTIDILEIWGLF